MMSNSSVQFLLSIVIHRFKVSETRSGRFTPFDTSEFDIISVIKEIFDKLKADLIKKSFNLLYTNFRSALASQTMPMMTQSNMVVAMCTCGRLQTTKQETKLQTADLLQTTKQLTKFSKKSISVYKNHAQSYLVMLLIGRIVSGTIKNVLKPASLCISPV